MSDEVKAVEPAKVEVPAKFEKLVGEVEKIEELKAEGFDGKRLDVIRVALIKDRHINAFIESLVAKLGEEKKTLLEQLDSRLDDNLNFFIRLDKEMLLKDKFVLTDSGNCYHIKISIAAFPKRREKAVGVLKELFCC